MKEVYISMCHIYALSEVAQLHYQLHKIRNLLTVESAAQENKTLAKLFSRVHIHLLQTHSEDKVKKK